MTVIDLRVSFLTSVSAIPWIHELHFYSDASKYGLGFCITQFRDNQEVRWEFLNYLNKRPMKLSARFPNSSCFIAWTADSAVTLESRKGVVAQEDRGGRYQGRNL